MENQILIIGVSVLVTSFAWFIYAQFLKNKLTHISNNHHHLNQSIEKEIIVRGNQNLDDLNKEIIALKSEISDTKHNSFMEGYQKAKNEFFLNITPYYEEYTEGDDGFIVNDFRHEVRVGYKQQLYVNNLPLLEPTIVWEKIIEERKREVDHQKIKSALEMVEKNLLPIVAQSNGILKFIPISENLKTIETKKIK